MGLGQQQIDESGGGPGTRAFDELQVFGAKNHDAQDAKVIGEFADGLLVEAEFAFGCGPINFDLVRRFLAHPLCRRQNNLSGHAGPCARRRRLTRKERRVAMR